MLVDCPDLAQRFRKDSRLPIRHQSARGMGQRQRVQTYEVIEGSMVSH